MEELHQEYRRLTGEQDVPVVIELPHSNGHAAAINAFIKTTFDQGLRLEDIVHGHNSTDVFIAIAKTTEELACRVLVMHHDHDKEISTYFEACNDPAVIEMMHGLARGSHCEYHFIGPDTTTALRSLGRYIRPEHIKRATGQHPYGHEYKHNGFTCIDVRVTNPLGIHARPAADLARTAMKYGGDETIRMRKGDDEINAKSIMSIMMIAASAGTEVTFMAKGPRAYESVQELYLTLQRINTPGYEQKPGHA